MSNTNLNIKLSAKNNLPKVLPEIQKNTLNNPQKVLDSNNSKTAKIVIVVVIIIVVAVGVTLGIFFYIQKKKEEAKIKWPDERCTNSYLLPRCSND